MSTAASRDSFGLFLTSMVQNSASPRPTSSLAANANAAALARVLGTATSSATRTASGTATTASSTAARPASTTATSSTTARPSSTATTTSTTTTAGSPPVAPVADLLQYEKYTYSTAPKGTQRTTILQGYRFAIIGSFSGWNQSDIKAYITVHGGRVESTITSYVANMSQFYVLISYSTYQNRHRKLTSKLRQALAYGAKCIKLDFLTDSVHAGTVEDVRRYMWPDMPDIGSGRTEATARTSTPTTARTASTTAKPSTHSTQYAYSGANLQATKRQRLNNIETLAELNDAINSIQSSISAQQFSAAASYGARTKGLLSLDWKKDENVQAKSKLLALTALAYSLSRTGRHVSQHEIYTASVLLEEALRLHHKNALAYFVRGRDRFSMGEYESSSRDLQVYLSIEKEGTYAPDAHMLIKKCKAFMLAVEYSRITESHANKQKYLDYAHKVTNALSEETINDDMLKIFLDQSASVLLKAAEISKQDKSKIYEHLQQRLDVAFEKKKEDEEEIVLEKASNTLEGFNGCCPVTSDRIRDPLRSKCNHVFEREGILFLLQGRTSIKCPVAGCNQVIQASDLVYDPILAEQLKTMEIAESSDEEEEEKSRTGFDGGSSTQQYTNVIVLGDSSDDDD